ncbi:unnamed protein product [Cochlearia groenlandica]
MSSLHGKSSGKFDIKSPVKKFFKYLSQDIDNTFDIISKEKIIEPVNGEKRTVKFSMNGIIISDSYKTFKATITVTPKKGHEVDGGHVAWTVEFEKFCHNVEDPVWIINILINYVIEVDENFVNI